MKRVHVVIDLAVAVFLVLNGICLWRLAVETAKVSRDIDDLRPAIEEAKLLMGNLAEMREAVTEPAQVLESIAGQVLSGGGGASVDRKARDATFHAYFERIKTSEYTFYRRGKKRSAESMASKLKGKYETWSMLILDDARLLDTITRSTEVKDGSVSVVPYQVEVEGQKLDLAAWLTSGE